MSLKGKKGLVVGIANEHSIAYGCAKAFRNAGADLAITYLNAKAEPYVRPLAEGLESSIIVPCDVREPGQLEALFARVEKDWGKLDFLLHSIALRPRKISIAASSTAPRPGSRWRWMCLVTRLSAWRISPSP